MANKIETLVADFVESVLTEMGYELVDVEYRKQNNQPNLTIFVTNEQGVSLDDLEKIHHVMDEKLDELNPTNDAPYILNVSSPGLDRPFKKDRDYLRNIGKEVEVKLFSPINNEKIITGVLEEYDGKFIKVNNQKEYKIDIKMIAKISLLVKFN